MLFLYIVTVNDWSSLIISNLISTAKTGKSWSAIIDDPVLRKFIDGQVDGRTDDRRAESDFIGHCPTSVERPI